MMQPGDGGVIGVSKDYEVVAEFNSQAMYRGWVADVQRVHDGCRGGGQMSSGTLGSLEGGAYIQRRRGWVMGGGEHVPN